MCSKSPGDVERRTGSVGVPDGMAESHLITLGSLQSISGWVCEGVGVWGGDLPSPEALLAFLTP